MTDQDFLESLLPEFRNDSWFAIALAAELKKVSSLATALDNVRKTLRSARHMLMNDPARRHVFALTIEDAVTRIWFMSRSQIIASEQFNFLSSPRELIRAISTFSFARPEQLGFDSTVSQFKDTDNRIQYKFYLKGVAYHTIRPLADYRADSIRGRATRVWLVHPEGQPDVHYVLKDVWMPSSDSLTEGDQLRLLHKHLASIVVPAGTRHPSEYFLDVVDDGYVTLAEGADDNTQFAMGGKAVPAAGECVPLVGISKAQTGGQASSSRQTGKGSETLRFTNSGLPAAPPLPIRTASQRKYFAPRSHYRIIFRQIGISIFHLTTLGEVMTLLADVIAALKILSDLGYVHRDISPGNICAVDGRGKVFDLEFLKAFRDEGVVPGLGQDIHAGPREEKTGSALFAAAEVERNVYCFNTPADRVARPVFRHNPLHDLESTLWIAIHTLVCRTTDPEGNLTPAQTEAWKTFFGQASADRRWDRRMFIQDGHFADEEFPEAFASLVKIILDAKDALYREGYMKFEATCALKDLDVNFMLQKFFDLYTDVANQSRDVRFFVAPMDNDCGIESTPAPDSNHGKRRRDTDHSDDDSAGNDDILPITVVSRAPAKRPKRANTAVLTAGPSQSRVLRSATKSQPPYINGTRRSARLAGSKLTGKKLVV
ncbi:hypothetical protein B0H15DRAFT_150986 [Mycena belliarum]|uniref:Fungal-type protein kinase domain-containing protein n=1 Tax=Mycena belliarum TaxID=1033014 RepID=A0AAD6U9F2_9AGAR|nr:hypothetical protein B0H15DRAFT_150986 [Mycena belliae]